MPPALPSARSMTTVCPPAQPIAAFVPGTLRRLTCIEDIAVPSPLLEPEFLLQDLVERLRVGLAARGFHGLADKPADERGFGEDLRHLIGIGGDDLIDDLLDRTQVRHLLHAAALDDRCRITL